MLFVEAKLNNKETLAIIDTRASHSFINTKEAKDLVFRTSILNFGIWYLHTKEKAKVVNSYAKKIVGTTMTKGCVDG